MTESTTPSNSPQSAATSLSRSFVSGFGLAITGVVGLLTLLQNYSNFRIVEATSYISARELSENYYPKDFVNTHYIEKLELNANYVSKADMEKQLSGLLTPEEVKSEYVPLATYADLQKTVSELNGKLYEIPTPFIERKKVLSHTGEWVDAQLGITLSVQKTWWIEGGIGLQLIIALPDSPLHFETCRSDELPLCKWTFIRNNREFELKAEKLEPLSLYVKEITR